MKLNLNSYLASVHEQPDQTCVVCSNSVEAVSDAAGEEGGGVVTGLDCMERKSKFKLILISCFVGTDLQNAMKGIESFFPSIWWMASVSSDWAIWR